MLMENENILPGSLHSNPAPLNVTVKTRIELGDPYSIPKIYLVEITLLDIKRGKDAWEFIKTQGIGSSPKEGFEYILVNIRFGYFRKRKGVIEDESYKLTESQFMAVSADGRKQYESPQLLQQPQPQLIGRVINPGDSLEGWILLQVPIDERRPLLVFKREHNEAIYGIYGLLWFQLY